jgi:helicase
MHELIEYNPLQRETIKFVEEDCNLVVLAPTSSGKTIVAEQFILPVLEKGGKAIYLSPLKALTQEKLDEWKPWGFPTVAMTGDHETKARPIVEQLILMTTEALDSKSRGARQFLKDAQVIVCDETQLLAVSGRGDAFEVGLTRFALLNSSARIIFLSATMPNAQELGDWLTSLNGKHTNVVETDWRPVEQEHILVKIPADTPWEFTSQAMAKVGEIVRRHPASQILAFVHSVNNGEKIAHTFRWPFHYSKIDKDTRHLYEDNYRTKKTMRMVATSTLAWGVNFPCDVGIIFGGHRGPTLVDAFDIKQMAGRIGRYGMAEKGIVYYLFMEEYADELYRQLSEMPPIISRLPERLYFHVVSFIAREGMQREEVKKFLSRTLAGRQMPINADEAIDKLIQYGSLTVMPDGVLVATALGKAAAMMYVDPIDLYFLRKNLASKPMSPRLIAEALISVPSMEAHTYVPRTLQEPIIFPFGKQTVYATYLRDWLEGQDIGAAAGVVIQPYVKDFERTIAALRMTAFDPAYLESMYMLLKYGVGKHLIELVSIEGIGRKRALALHKSGIKTKADFLEKQNLARNIVGINTYAKARFSLTNKNPKAILIQYDEK